MLYYIQVYSALWDKGDAIMDCSICGKIELGFFDRGWIRGKSDICVCNNCYSTVQKAKAGNVEEYKAYLELIAKVKDQAVLTVLDEIMAPQQPAIQKSVAQQAAKQKEQQEIEKIMLTTGYDYAGYRIENYQGVISGACVLGTGFLSEVGASLSDFLGTKSTAFSDKLNMAKDFALEELKRACFAKQGNAVIGVDFDYITFANNMVGVIANGTAVKIQKADT